MTNLTFIVAEFNPITNGHEYIIREAKRLLPDNKLVVIMSGNFVQRGEPAIIDKANRTSVALSLGADAVFELPLAYSISSAEDFAYGAIKLASSFAGDNTLVFGSECGDLQLLENAETKLREMNNSPLLKKNLKSGKSFATSQIEAIGGVCFHPNNLLGVMYLKAIKDLNSRLNPLTITRIGDYNSTDTNNSFVSATALREKIYLSDFDSIAGKMPEKMIVQLKNSKIPNIDLLFTMLKYKFITTKMDDIEKIEGVREGIQYRIKDKLKSAKNFTDLITLVSTKRYPESKVRRILLNVLFEINKETKQAIKAGLNYFRVLGVNQKELYPLLATSSMKIVTKKKDEKALDEKQHFFLELDNLSDEIYDLMTK